MIELYFAIGAGFYLGLAMNNVESFKTNTPVIYILGGILLGFVFWPIGVIVKITLIVTEKE